MTELLGGPLRVINVGLPGFLDSLEGRAGVIHCDWQPPATGDPAIALLLAELEDDAHDRLGASIMAANERAVATIVGAQPRLIGVQPAGEVLTGLPPRTLLHAGPPITWERMCGPMQGAVLGAILFEGWALDAAAARGLAASGAVQFVPCHDFQAVGPMAGLISPSMPVLIVENQAAGNRAFATLNEGLGRVLRFGAFDDGVLQRLRWMRTTLAPALAAALAVAGPIDLRAIIAQALHMGDECHNRNVAATSLFARQIGPVLVRTASSAIAGEVLDFLAGNDHFFLNLSMAACKSALDAVPRDPACTVVTAMARNGVEFGIRVAGTGDRWFTAPAGVPQGLYFPGCGPEQANPDLGDSAITETMGLGGFAMAAAPAIVRFVGGSPTDAIRQTQQMGQITLARNPNFSLPPLDFSGTPTAIDIRRVVETGVTPVINTGIAHRDAGVGQIGAGIVRAPLACFVAALQVLGANLGALDMATGDPTA